MERGASAAGEVALGAGRAGMAARLAELPWWRIAPTLLASALAALFLITDPRPVDLAAHVFRADLFGEQGFSIWNGQWYSGHHTPGYSVLAPALGWLLGPALMGALSAVAAAALFEQIARALFGDRARLGALWFGAGTATMLFSGRVTFALGVALGLGAVLMLQRRRAVLAVLLALLCTLASPVAGLFAALAGVGVAAARKRGKAARERSGSAPARTMAVPGRSATHARQGSVESTAAEVALPLAVAVAAIAPPLLLAAAFPAGGEHPFPFSSYVAIPLVGLAVLVLTGSRDRTLRLATALYVVGATVAYLIATPLGGNSVRLGALFGGPVLACVLSSRGTDGAPIGRLPRVPRILLVAMTLAALAYWQVAQAVEDVNKVSGDPAAQASYYAPLNAFFAEQRGAFRIEIPFTRAHWEAAEVAPRLPLARGWERQLDTKFNELFYDGSLDERSYERWLRQNGVRFVALPDAILDAHGKAEGSLVAGGEAEAGGEPPQYLRLRKRLEHWRVYEVTPAPPLVVSETGARMRVTELDPDRVRLDVERPGTGVVRVRWSPYWRATATGAAAVGPQPCVSRAGDWTRLEAPQGGAVTLEMSFSPLRALAQGPRCG